MLSPTAVLPDSLCGGVGDRASPTIAQRALASAVTQLRLAEGLSQVQVAKALTWQPSKVSMIENEQRTLKEADLAALLDLFDVAEVSHSGWWTLQQLAREKSWWENSGPVHLPKGSMRFIGFEQGADGLRSYQPGIIYDLFQTEAYAAALVRQGPKPLGEQMVRRRIELVTRRQKVLDHEIDPLSVWVISDESVLRRVVGDHGVMGDQLAHLAKLADKPNVTIQVVPTEGAGAAVADGTFTIFSLPWGQDPAVCLERLTETLVLDSPDDVDVYSMLFDQLLTLALSPPESLALIELHLYAHRRRHLWCARP